MILYSFRLSGLNHFIASLLVMATTAFAVVPNAPSNLSASVINSTTLYLSVDDNSTNETGFDIALTPSGQPTQRILILSGSVSKTTATTATTGNVLLAVPVVANTTYTVQVASYQTNTDAGNISAFTTPITVTTADFNAPNIVSVTPLTETSFRFLTVDNQASEAGMFYEYTIPPSTTFTVAGNVGANASDFPFSGWQPGTTYQFRARGFKGTAASPTSLSGYSAVVTATSPFNAPTSLTATSGTEGRVNLSWVDNSAADQGYAVYIRPSGSGSYALMGYSAVNANSLAITGLAPQTAYDFQVAAAYQATPTSSFIESARSNTASATTPQLNAPTSLTATSGTEGRVNLSWVDNSVTEGGYAVYIRPSGSGSYILVNYTAANAGSFSITDLAPQTAYDFQVAAAYQTTPTTVIESARSNTASATTQQLNAPTGFTATVQNDSSVIFTWADNSSTETHYEIQFSPASANNFKKLGDTINPNATSITLTGLIPNQSYDFKVRAVFNSGAAIRSSAFSSVVTRSTNDGFTSATYRQIAQNRPFTYQAVVSTFSTRTSWNITGLPTGLTFSSSTGQVTGTPAVFGLFNCPMTATFANGATASTTLTLRVVLPPIAAAAIPAQTFTIGGDVSIPLADKFTDPDTTSAARLVTSQGTMDFILYDTSTQTQNATPQTVANFLSYVRNFGVSDTTNKYDAAVFHRSIPGFIVQGGAFKVQSAPNNFSSFTTAPSPLNEPFNSNSRGTVAMAKIGGDPNSATNQFFVNLADNSAILDGQNGGFTAFARVAGDGLAVADAIATLPTVDSLVNVGGASNTSLTNWPLTSASTVMDTTKMVSITSATKNVPVMTYAITGNTNSTAVSASINTTVDASGISSSRLQINGGSTGQSDVTVTATDLDGNTVSQTFTVTASQAPLFTNGPPPSTAVVGTAYNFAYTASGFPVPTFSHTGTLPPGLSLSSTGVISGTPTAAGTYSGIVVTASNGIGVAPTQTISITVDQIPSITSAAPAAGIVGTAYTHTYAATGSPAPTYSLTAGALPGGLSVSTAGVISGTPNTAGTFTGTITSTNRAGSFPQAFSITINQAPAFTSSVPTTTGLLGTAYSFTSAASGFPAPTFSVPANTLPTGLNLNPTTGVISGTPSATGVFSGTLTASNGIGSNATQAFTITINQAPAFTSSTPTNSGTFNTAYNFSCTASGFPAPSFSVATGALPTGLSLSTSGVISGTPTAAGTYTGTLSASNGIGSAASQSFSITIQQAAATVALGSLAPTYTGSPLAATSTTNPANLSVSYTYDGLSTIPTNAGSYAVVASINEPNYVGTANGTLVIAKATATVSLGSLAQTYNGSAKAATATTSPTGLTVNLTYDGSATAPTNAATYAVVGTINDTNYAGSAAGTLVIAKATATITLNGLTQAYDGSAKSVSTTTSPLGLMVNVTYNGSTSAPTSHGSHAVLAVVDDSNYNGSASGTLLIQGQSMSQWRTQHFSPEQITAGLADDDTDPDGDGWKNLAEYALGMNPMSRNPALLPVRDANGLTLNFTRPKDMPDVIYGAQSTDDLAIWNARTLEVISDGPVQTMRVRDPLTNGNPSRRIMRLIFDRPAPIE
jgi:cyclophilin family peptidyl-prolyl cis-trans isomerase